MQMSLRAQVMAKMAAEQVNILRLVDAAFSVFAPSFAPQARECFAAVNRACPLWRCSVAVSKKRSVTEHRYGHCRPQSKAGWPRQPNP